MNWWQWCLLSLGAYVIIGVGFAVWTRSIFIGVIWPLAALYALIGGGPQ